MSPAMLTAIGGVLTAFSPPITAWVQGYFAKPVRTAVSPDGTPLAPGHHERRPWMIPVATAAWIIAIALAFVLIISALASGSPIMSNPLVDAARAVIALIAAVAVSSGATGIAVTLRHSPEPGPDSGQPRPDLIRGACYVIGGLLVITAMVVIA